MFLDQSELLNLLWKKQEDGGYISEADIEDVARVLHLSAADVEGVCSFYHFFRRKPAGKFSIYLNNSILSENAGYAAVRAAFEQATEARWGGVDRSGAFGLYDTACIGLSDQEPAALINFQPFTRLTPEKVAHIVSELRRGAAPEALADAVDTPVYQAMAPERAFIFPGINTGGALSNLKIMRADEVLAEIRRSGLRGMGGAFFPLAEKWDACRRQPATPRYLICNADEGEPGTFKDRVILSRIPEALVEGMIAGAYAMGAREGIIYLRAEYRYLLPKLEAVLKRYRGQGWLGANIPALEPFDFDIRIQLGAGAYVCGEETALINSLMGLRGEPSPKVYFPTERGYRGLPTAVNNVETLVVAARVLELGADAFLERGIEGNPGVRLLSVAGDCRRPGVYEIEWGLTLGELLDLCGAENPAYVQISGPSGFGVDARERTRRFSLEDLRCGGSVMIFNGSRDLLQILQNFTHFFRDESCGVCTPCRAGNFILAKKLELMAKGLARPSDLRDMRQWGQLMALSSRCGLGKAAARSLIEAMHAFPEYFNQRVKNLHLEKGFDLEEALGDYRKAVLAE